jgi:hypothetical protein
MLQCQTRQTADFGCLLKAVYHSLYMSYPVSQLLLPSEASLMKINSLAHSEKKVQNHQPTLCFREPRNHHKNAR